MDAYHIIASKKYISTAKLQLNSHISRLKKGHTDPVSKLVDSDLINSLLEALNEAVANVVKLGEQLTT